MSKGTIFAYFNKTPKGKEQPPPKVETPADTPKKGKENVPVKRKIPIPKYLDVNAGDMVWARLEGYPWWPAIVCDHPATNCIIKDKGAKNAKVHVQFFEEVATRSWVRHSALAKFEGTDNRECERGGKYFSTFQGWYEGCQLAEKAFAKPIDERKALIQDQQLSDEEEPFNQEIFDAEMSDEDFDISKEKKAKNDNDQLAQSFKRKRTTRSGLVYDDSEDDYKPGDEKESSSSSDEGINEDEVEENETMELEEETDDLAVSPKAKKPPKKKAKLSDSISTTPVSKRTISKLSGFDSNIGGDSKSSTQEEELNFKHLHFEFIKPEHIRDADRRRPSDSNYDATTLYVPSDFLLKQTPAQRQWWTIKSSHFDTVLFFKMGKFYELFHMDAVIGVQELNLIYMKGELCHAGFPEVAFSRYADTLIKRGFKVARIEQTETPDAMDQRTKGMKSKDKVIRREICSIQTKGVRKYSFIDGDTSIFSHTYLLALYEKDVESKDHGKEFGVCFIDTSVGLFQLGQFMDDRHNTRLRTLIAQHPPAQVIYDKDNLSAAALSLLQTTLPSAHFEALTVSREVWTSENALKLLMKYEYFAEGGTTKWPDPLSALLENADSVSVQAKRESELSFGCLGCVIWYLRKCEMDDELLSMRQFAHYMPSDVLNSGAIASSKLVLDGVTLTNLSLLPPCLDSSASDVGSDGSLLTRIDTCQTAPGHRLLRQWLCAPLTLKDDIEARQRAVEDLVEAHALCSEIRCILGGMPDIPRLLTRIHALGSQKRLLSHPDGRAVFMDELVYNKKKVEDFLLALEGFKNGYKAISILAKQKHNFRSEILQKMCTFADTASDDNSYPEMLEKLKFYDDAFDHAEAKKEGVIIPRRGVDPEYDEAKDEIDATTTELNDYLRSQKRLLGAHGMSFWGRGKDRFQMELTESFAKKVPPDYELTSSKKGAKRYRSTESKRLFKKLVEAEERRDASLRDSMRRIFYHFSEQHELWTAACSCLAVLDVLLCLAEYSRSGDATMCKPTICSFEKEPFLSIKNGRHPCMTSSCDDFIPNDTDIGSKSSEEGNTELLVLVTGPNMGGKSTLMRQVGQLVILAQLGSYVPASSCSLTPVDRVFTRLGAADDILAGESTFYVELSETSSILQHATKHSLVLLDELGRGTATYDGSAIAAGVVHDLCDRVGCRVLFSTHYHSLVEQFRHQPNVRLGHMSCMVEDDDEDLEKDDEASEESVVFLYKFVSGACPKSFGFNAARLAGLPQQVIRAAVKKASEFQSQNQDLSLFRDLSQADADSTAKARKSIENYRSRVV